MLDFSRFEIGQITLETVDFDPRGQLEEICEDFRLRAQGKGLELKVDFSRVQKLTACGDPGRLQQIVGALVGNAIKFTDDGEVTIKMQGDVSITSEPGRGSTFEFHIFFDVGSVNYRLGAPFTHNY